MASALLARASSRSIRSSTRLACQYSSVSLASSSKRALPRTLLSHYHFSTSEEHKPEDASATPASLQTATLTTATNSATEVENTSRESGASSDKDLGEQRRISIYDMDYFRLRDIDDIQEFESLVDQLEQMPTLTSDDIGPLLVPLTRRTCELGFGMRGAEITERVLFDCLSRLPLNYADRKPEHPYPVATMYNRSIIAWGNLRTHEGAKRAERIFQLMMSEYKQEAEWVREKQQKQQGVDGIIYSVRAEHPDRRCFKSLLRAWAISGSPHGPARAYNILLEMERLSDVSKVLEAINQKNELEKQQQGEKNEQTPLDGEGEKVVPNVKMDGSASPFGVVNNEQTPLDGESEKVVPNVKMDGSAAPFGVVNNEQTPLDGEGEIMVPNVKIDGSAALFGVVNNEQTPLDGEGEKVVPNVKIDGSAVPFGVVNNEQTPLDGEGEKVVPDVKIGVSAAPFEVFGGSKDQSSASSFNIERPDQACYNSVLSAYAKAFVLKHPHALNRIKELIARMAALHEATGDEEYTLDWISYHAVLRAYSKYAAYTSDPLDRAFVEEVEAILRQIYRDNQRMLRLGRRPITDNLSMPWAYGVAIEAWTKTLPISEGVQQAEDIIMALLGRKELKNIPNPGRGWARQENIIQVVRTWQRSGLPESEERIQELMRVVVESPYERIHFLHDIMEAWVSSDWDLAPEVVERMLEWSFSRMDNIACRPTGQTFMIAIKGWLRSKSEDAPYRAELILNKLVEIYDHERDVYYRPREIHLRYVMTAWMNRCEDGRRYYGHAGNMYPAEHVESLLALYGDADWNDNVHGLYAMAIRTWAKQRVPVGETEPNPLRRAIALLNMIGERTGQLDAYASNWVLEACCRAQPTVEKRRESYDAAMETFRRGKRNQRTFVLLMKVLRAQILEFDKAQQKLVEDLFHECCSMGYLSQDMVWEIASIATPSLLNRLFNVSHEYANFVVQVRDNRARGATISVWTENPPTDLLVQNLPKAWSIRVKDNLARPQAAAKK
jgi:hypothetical protein